MIINLVGATLDKYHILSEVGRGGMAVVYKARDTSLGRIVALKVLPPTMGMDTELVHRFQDEARNAALLQHPNIVQIWDVGESKGIHFIAMNFLEGETLHRLIQRTGALSPDLTVSVLRQIASALDYAHAQHMVHRDVKPANIIVSSDGVATLTDFGLARALSGNRLTRTGLLVGTPEFMSPEQADGQELDHRSDLYSLAVVVHEMLVGAVPFTGSNPHAILYAHVHKIAPAPSSLNGSLPTAVDAVVARGLAKTLEARYQSASDMAADLAGAFGSKAKAPAADTGAAAIQPLASKAASPKPRPLAWAMLGIAGAVIIIAAILASQSGSMLPATVPPATARPATAVVANSPVPSATPQQVSQPPAPTVAMGVPTVTLAPTSTAAPTVTLIATPTASATATRAPAPTVTVAGLPTTAPTRAPTAASNPGMLYAAPALQGPDDRATFNGAKANVVLRWSAVAGLGASDSYAVTVLFPPWAGKAGDLWPNSQLTRDTSTTVPSWLYAQLGGDRKCSWTVAVVRNGAIKPDGSVEGAMVSPPSLSRTFTWQGETTGGGGGDTPCEKTIPPCKGGGGSITVPCSDSRSCY